MDIICKDCGHAIDDHLPDGCFHCENGTTSVNNTCLCDRIPSEVATMFFTEQQARLDTCRAQVTALIAERNALKEVEKDFQWLLSVCAHIEIDGIQKDTLNKLQKMMVKYVG